MLISSYNQKALGDILIVYVAPDVEEQAVETRQTITRIFDPETNETLGYNFADVSAVLGKLDVNGQVFLTDDQVDRLNDALANADFAPNLKADHEPKFVVGYVKTADQHPDSNHLLVTQTEVQDGQVLQIVSGSPNMQADIKVVVAEVGAMMPDGLIIWPGKLRGVESDGMISSGRELRIPNAPDRPGALILPDDYEVGQPFNFDKAQTLFQ
ncbi:YtpR family tRNA-binding protein [Secundilactobacillus collinoides]|uniref:tRNA-binding domain protein n=1 Tax=Secundilactobacillus collinoides DSM 20515 = JCM 1123 TaxID=1423733 RepID=A0A0R2B8Z7_SECCO|nr:DUF4479 and tRNA-binding domain-containing protein [Secundilactobacillus collinoides]KRM74340.1 tRNA-binding domain protein [Secundilactobacillus collinoides DSM 20515 = JCM 1123]